MAQKLLHVAKVSSVRQKVGSSGVSDGVRHQALASHALFHIVRVGVPVQVKGLAICPHDLLHGDDNGLIVVPKEGLEKLPAEVEAVRTRERALMEFVRGPGFTLE